MIAGNTEFLEKHGEGIQHVAVACGELSMDERIREFEKRGFVNIQSGVFNGNLPYAYFGTEDAAGTVFEIFDIPEEGLPARRNGFRHRRRTDSRHAPLADQYRCF